MEESKTCCFTGHRPEYFPWNGDISDPRHKELLYRIEKSVDLAIEQGARRFLCGNALGVDTWAAQVVLKKKERDSDIVLEIAKPFKTHNDKYKECVEVCRRADFVNIIGSEKTHVKSLFERNRYMVDNSEIIIAVYDAAPKGGTKWTYDYAKNKGIEIIQVLWRDI